ncbi:MAG: histidinol-phosphate transaminase [Bdellovibrionaceae bacterium]|nr:histidinol-phosphate transaminase [Pseudobdellovibrionaceae bacterium]
MKVSREILNLVPYRPGKPISETKREFGLDRVIKLASNENPLGPSPLALVAVQKALQNQHRYPDPTCYDLISTLSDRWRIPPNNLGIGNGSDEIIDLLIRIYCEPGDSILTSQAAFAAYEVSAGAARVKVAKVPLRSDYGIDLQVMADYFLKNSTTQRIRLIFVPNPNNPTGRFIPRVEIEKFISTLGGRDDVLLVFDEAYNEFVRHPDYESVFKQVLLTNNLVLLKTFSKSFGMAGFRLGTLIAPSEVIELFNRVRKPFNVNDLAQVAAIAAIDDQKFIQESQRLTWEGLDFFMAELTRLQLPWIPSEGNFITFDTGRDALKVYEALLRRGIILRPILNYGFKTHLRMSVGLMDENRAAIQALEAVLEHIPQEFFIPVPARSPQTEGGPG